MTEETNHSLQLPHGELAQRARKFARQHEDPPL
jgi:hypothetical protein